MQISKSAIALAVTAALSSMTSVVTADAKNAPGKVFYDVTGSRHAAAPRATCDPSGICLVSTVGTDLSPGACGAVNTIDATVGDQLNFCYTVTNNTGVELDYQWLANDVDGSLFAFEPLTVAPGGSYQYNHVETVADTLTYTSTWKSYDVLPGFTAEVESGGGCGDRIFADGFEVGSPSCSGGFVDITGTGTALGLGDDDTFDVTLPFPLGFYGTTSNQLTISNNGGAIVGAPGAYLGFQNTTLPATSLPGPGIFPLWDDFDSESGDVYTDVRGAAPNRQFIVEWFNRMHYSANADGATFELILDEDGTIQFEYADVAYTNDTSPSDPPDCTGGACATIGLQGSTAMFSQFSAFEAAVADNSGIKWTPTTPQIFTSTDAVTVNVGAPDIDVQPAMLSGTVVAGGATTLPLDVQNLGDRDLVWTADEALPSDFHFPYGPRYAASTVQAGESHLAAIAPSASWRAAHGHAHKGKSGKHGPAPQAAGVPSFGCNFTSSSGCDFVSFDADAPGTLDTIAGENEALFAAAFVANDFTKEYTIGYPSGDLETIDTTTGAITDIGATGQGGAARDIAYDPITDILFGTAIDGSGTDLFTIDRATGAMTLIAPISGLGAQAYVMGLAVDPDTGLMYGIEIVTSSLVAIDKTTGAATTIGALGYTTRYSQGLDFDAATGVLYLASIDYDAAVQNMYTVDTATGAATLIGAIGNDILQLGAFGIAEPSGPCGQPSDLPWLSLSPNGGTTAPGADTPMTATIDATGTADGDILSGTVCVRSNDPDEHVVTVPISVNVTGAPPPVPPTVAKSFSPAQVTPGESSTLTITLSNANAADATLNAALVDAFPFGLQVASTPNAQTTCGGSLTAGAGTDSVMLDAAGASIPMNGSCTITVDVIGVSPNAFANDIPAGALDTSAGTNTAPADATLDVAFAAPTLVKSFAPTSITIGTTSTLTLTLGNPNGVPTALTAPLTDSFPTGLVVAASPNAGTTCASGTVITASGGLAVTLGSGAVIPAGDTCTVSVDVTAAAPGTFANDIPADSLQTMAGANTDPADATLNVAPIPPTVSKAFGASPVSVNVPSTLTITLGNANALDAVLTAALVDAFPTDLVVAATPNASTDCGGALTADPAAGSVTLDAGAIIPGGGSCTITVDVESALIGLYANDIPIDAMQTTLGNNIAPADAALDVTP